MIAFDKEEIVDSLGLVPFGNQGWLSNNEDCPFCHKPKKWGVLMDGDANIFHCWKCSTKTSLYNFLKELGRLDLVRTEYVKSNKSTLMVVGEQPTKLEREELPEVTLPIKLQPLINDPYLDSRNFLPMHYKEFEPSFTDYFMESRLKNYIIFKIKQNGIPVAWLARSRRTKEWHIENLKYCKEQGLRPTLRYRNSECDFTKILGGMDTVQDGVENLIIVEGLFDKVNVDYRLCIDQLGTEFGCCFTFGKSLSNEQIELICSKHPKKVTLMYDEDAREENKSYALKLSHHVKTVIASITVPGKDPGDLSLKELWDTLENEYAPINYYTQKLVKKIG